nr:alpha/beta hydrolase [uncultured Schaedlerella sp.]
MKTESYKIWQPGEYSYDHAFGFVPNIVSYIHEDDVKRPCILVVPGGAYCVVAPSEGELVARKFYEKGYQTFVLTYTVNFLQSVPLKLQPLKDISRAVRYIRKNADAFAVIEDELTVCGFSAGGHLCGSLCVHYEDIGDNSAEYSGISNRPDSAILSYPVITSGDGAHRGSFVALLGEGASAEELEYMSLEKHVTEQTPPCFLWATATDETVPVENSEMYVRACREKGVPCAFHMFTRGKHGLSLADEDWANGVHMSLYTEEQLVCVMRKVKSGEVTVPERVRAEWEEQEKRHAGEVRVPEPEVTVWPELADAFLKNLKER